MICLLLFAYIYIMVWYCRSTPSVVLLKSAINIKHISTLW